MTDEQLIASAQALLDLDARGALVPHGIGGHARTIIEGFLALSRRVPASGGKADFYAGWSATGMHIGMWDSRATAEEAMADMPGSTIVPLYLAASPIVAAPEGWRTVPVELTPEMLRAGMENLAWWTDPRAPEYEQGGLIADGLTEEEAADINSQLMQAFKEMYSVVLAAAPSIPEGKAEPAAEEKR